MENHKTALMFQLLAHPLFRMVSHLFVSNFSLLGAQFSDENNQKQRSSHQRWSVKKGIPENFTKFTGKHLYQSLFFNKVTDLRPVSFLVKLQTWDLKKRLWHRCFPVNFGKFLRALFHRTPPLAASGNSRSASDVESAYVSLSALK